MTDKISWAIVGTGQASAQFAQGLSLIPDARLQAVCSRNFTKAQSFAHVYSSGHVYPTYEDILADPLVDVVYIGTPHTLHKQQCLQALNAGKHVLCEKPFTMNALETKEVISCAKTLNRLCMEAMWMRCVPLICEAVDAVRSGTIGEICMLSACMGHPIRVSNEHRLLNPELGGGALMDLGVYPLSLAQLLLGTPEHVETLIKRGETAVDVQVSSSLRYASGALASIACSFETLMSNDCVIMGTEGTLRIHAPLYRPTSYTVTRHQPMEMGDCWEFRPLSLTKRIPLVAKTVHLLREKFLRLIKGESRTVSRLYEGNAYQYEALEAMRCIREGKIESELIPHSDTIAVMETLDRMRSQKERMLG